MPDQHRRLFLKQTAFSALAGTMLLKQASASGESATNPAWPTDTTILFQGDSITDEGRNRKANGPNDAGALGHGYAFLAAAQLLGGPDGSHLNIYNRGDSGNKVFQLADRWDKDCLQFKPNVLSILVGVNDFWHTLVRQYQGTVEIYERDYHALLQRTRQALPHVQLVICEPYVLKYGAVDEQWFPTFDHYRAAALRVAKQANALFVPFQQVMNQALRQAPASFWVIDGVHPTVAGSYLLAQAWLKAVNGSRS